VTLGAGRSHEADAASPRVAPTSHAGSTPESRVDGVLLCQGPACARPQRSPELSLRRAELARTPGPIAGRGYRVVFVDTFERLRRRVWDNREWWNTPPPRGSQYVRRGVLHLVSRRSDGYPSHIAVTTFSSQKVFRYGYFEARMKWTKGNGSWPGFWMISNAWAKRGGDCSRPVRAAEIDVFEGYGNHPRVFTGTIHRHSAVHVCPSPPDAINSNNWQPQRVDLTRRFHTYAMRWTPARVTWFLDERKIMSWPVFETTNTRMFLLLSMYTGGESQPDSSSPAALHTKVNWVRVWQKR
jgi:Glycosyl hydrolases family 16